MSVTIYHNPRCSKSRQTLTLISQSGTEHAVVLYLEDAPDALKIKELAESLRVSVADLLRRGEPEFKDARDLPELSDDDALAAWLAAHPKVLERPIVVDNDSGRTVMGRPPENILALLS